MTIFAALAMYVSVRIFSTDKVLTAKFSFKRLRITQHKRLMSVSSHLTGNDRKRFWSRPCKMAGVAGEKQGEVPQQQITQHKKFALWAHLNFCFTKTSFMLETLYAIPLLVLKSLIPILNVKEVGP